MVEDEYLGMQWCCRLCQSAQVCPTEGCLCRSWEGAVVDTSLCKSHKHLADVVLRDLDSNGCGCCARKCETCGCTETSNTRCKARVGNKGSEHTVGQVHTVRKDGKVVCSGCVADPMCLRCRATSTHMRYCAVPASAAAAAATGGGGAAAATAAQPLPVLPGFGKNKHSETSLRCKACSGSSTAQTKKRRQAAGDESHEGMKDSTGEQAACVRQPKMEWSMLSLAQWGGVYSYFVNPSHYNGEYPENESRITRYVLAARLSTHLGILEPDARKAGCLRIGGQPASTDLIHRAFQWLARHSKVRQGRGVDRGVPRAVVQMAKAMERLADSGPVVITETVRLTERAILTSLKAEVRPLEFERFRIRYDMILR